MYKDMFKKADYEPFVIEEAKKLLLNIWHKPEDVKLNAIKTFAKNVCEKFNVPVPKIDVNPTFRGMYGCYIQSANFIGLGNYSLVTFLHEFRHYMQHHVTHETSDRDQMEEDARGWSVSLFYILAPEKYERAVQRGKLVFS